MENTELSAADSSDLLLSIFLALIAIVQVVLLVGALIRRKQRNSIRGRTIYPRYEPPHGVSPLQAAAIFPKGKHGIASELLDLAVKRIVRIIAFDRPGRRRTRWGVELLQPIPPNLAWTTGRVAEAFFGGTYTGLVELRRLPSTTKRTLGEVSSTVRKDPAYFSSESRGTCLGILAIVVLCVAGFGLSFMTFERESETVALIFAGLCSLTSIAFLVGMGKVVSARSLSEGGLRVLEQLEGLRMFMTIAESDRLRMLQAPATAHREPHHAGQLLRLYEPLLPFAAIFNILPQWGNLVRDLAHISGADGGSGDPGWYTSDGSTGNDFADAGDFGRALEDFAASVDSSAGDGSSSDSSSDGDGGGDGGGGGGD
ncbi:MAG: DUF2207 family protein [Gulosibacter sp.]|uniref:DUF2207 family protein n=1 Tax=Gulosibacter sp. TaxID=2817531 RepID=UPI003F92C86D